MLAALNCVTRLAQAGQLGAARMQQSSEASEMVGMYHLVDDAPFVTNMPPTPGLDRM
jgi:hypothetical protein